MSLTSSNIGRVPTLMASRMMLGTINSANRQMLNTQIQLATGRNINRPSDDVIGSSLVTVLDDVIERRDQRLRNLSHAEAVLNNVDASLGDVSDMLLEAQSIGLSQIGATSDPQVRANQAQVISAMIDSLLNISNRDYQNIHYFGGSQTNKSPFESHLGGIRYTGQGDGMLTDLGQASTIPITLSGSRAFGAVSARVQGERDLDPSMVGTTKLSNLQGAVQQGIRLNTINIDINGTDVEVDLTGVHTAQDVVDALEAAIQTVDGGAVVQIDPASGDRFEIIPSGGVTITISDVGGDGAATDLGIAGTFTPGSTTGSDLNPKLTSLTRLDQLTGVTVPLGTIRLSNAGHVRNLDLSAAETIEDVQNAVASLNIGIRVEISEAGDRLNFVNELSGTNMSIAEVAGGTTASELGVRSLTGSTLLSDFNDGVGVSRVTDAIDPVTGLPDPARDLDFRVTVSSGVSFDVDLTKDTTTVQHVIDAINAAAAGAGLGVPAEFEARLAADGNGIELEDLTGGVGTFAVTQLNGSNAAADLGILGTAAGAVITGEDRATVAVDSVFTHLIALRDALLNNDTPGISLATSRIETDVPRVAEARATVGVRTRRVLDAVTHEEDLKLQDTALRSEVQDLDYTEAAIRFATLQTQLQAALTSASQALQLSLMDFLR